MKYKASKDQGIPGDRVIVRSLVLNHQAGYGNA